MTTKAKIGDALRAACLAKQLTERDVAAVTGVSLHMLHQLESGVGTADINTLLAVCESVGMVLLLALKAVAKNVLPIPASQPARRGNLLTKPHSGKRQGGCRVQ